MVQLLCFVQALLPNIKLACFIIISLLPIMSSILIILRKRKAVMSMISTECERTGTDISIDRQAIAARVFNALDKFGAA